MLIGISGMISCGKSTLIHKLVSHYKDQCLFLDEYEEDDEVFNTFLKWLYEGKKNISLGLQTYVVENHLWRVNNVLDTFEKRNMKQNENFVFIDRFILEHYIFAHVNFQNANSKYFSAYQKAFEEAVTKKELPDFVIYLDLDFETFQKRIFKRGRKVEIENFNQNKEYFEVLLNAYKQNFTKLCDKFGVPYITLNTINLDETQVLVKVISVLEEFKNKQNLNMKVEQ
ncbi:deoxynucleoside kinase [Mycoplasmopsis ciconiae]|uniref:Deoxynucleoside kinase n=1 Tax=Mycoplasmopsis ciconiae TaxID=561067 RepID=A0ABU7MKV6_9BACT|nr:deoxynucleoside kinase [Mycoplasmopsis ciconiae]